MDVTWHDMTDRKPLREERHEAWLRGHEPAVHDKRAKCGCRMEEDGGGGGWKKEFVSRICCGGFYGRKKGYNEIPEENGGIDQIYVDI